MSNKPVTQLLHLHDHMVKDPDIRYMQAWLTRRRRQRRRVSAWMSYRSKKGHTYRIVVSDLERGRPIWIGRTARTEVDLDRLFLDLGVPKRRPRIRLAVTDRWKAIRNSVQTHTPQAQMLFDTFHILRHLADAMDQVRRVEYTRVATKDRAFTRASA